MSSFLVTLNGVKLRGWASFSPPVFFPSLIVEWINYVISSRVELYRHHHHQNFLTVQTYKLLFFKGGLILRKWLLKHLLHKLCFLAPLHAFCIKLGDFFLRKSNKIIFCLSRCQKADFFWPFLGSFSVYSDMIYVANKSAF